MLSRPLEYSNGANWFVSGTKTVFGFLRLKKKKSFYWVRKRLHRLTLHHAALHPVTDTFHVQFMSDMLRERSWWSYYTICYNVTSKHRRSLWKLPFGDLRPSVWNLPVVMSWMNTSLIRWSGSQSVLSSIQDFVIGCPTGDVCTRQSSVDLKEVATKILSPFSINV